MGLSFFPEPFEDELLYSVMARVREMTALSHHAVVNLFCGKDNAWVNVDLPLRLSYVADRIGPEVISCDTLIEHHTLFAYYMGFLDCPAYTHARQIAADGWKGVGPRSIKFHLPAIGSSGRLRFCPDCVKVDKDRAGIAGWRRSHQCPGVFVCPKHGTELLETQTPSTRTKVLVCCPGDQDTVSRVANPFDNTVARSIASSTAWLLAHPQRAVGTAVLRRRMRLILSEQDWVSKNKGIAREDLHRAVVKYYGTECLHTLGIDPGSSSWISQLYQVNYNAQKHPLQYLLLLTFLGLDSASLFNIHLDEQIPNPEHHRGAAAVFTLRHHSGSERTIVRHRTKLETFLKQALVTSRTDLPKELEWSVTYLRKHDNVWLDTAFPLKSKKGKPEVNWTQRDQELAILVLRAAETMRRAPDRPRRISRTRLSRAVEFPRLAQCLGRLPNTAEALAQSVEGELTFQRRQLHWAAERLVREGTGSCTRAKLVSGANRTGSLLPELIPEVDELVMHVNEDISPE